MAAETPARRSGKRTSEAVKVKDNMFDFISRFLGTVRKTALSHLHEAVRVTPVPAPTQGATPDRRPQPQVELVETATSLRLPLRVITSGFPPNLMAKLRDGNTTALTVSLPLDMILPQLSRGAVQIPFGAVRLACQGAFLPDADCDGVLVSLPLAEILSRIDPSLIPRRNSRRRLEVPDDIEGPFQPKNGAPVPLAPLAPPIIKPATNGATAAQGYPAHPRIVPSKRMVTPAPQSEEINARLEAAAPAPAAVPVPAAINGSKILLLSLPGLMEGWPQALRLEIAQMNLNDAKVALPMEQVQEGLKRGKLAFTWKTLRAWIKPAVPAGVSARDSLTLDLPLAVVAPLFFSKQGPAERPKTKVSFDTDIPDVFFGSKPTTRTTTPAPANGRLGTSTSAVKAPGENNGELLTSTRTGLTAALPMDEEAIEVPDTLTPSPKKPQAIPTNPHGVVFRCATIKGVAGAIVVSADGLPVASRLPKEMNADKLAAFVQQIFNRLGQNTADLAMGELSHLTFTVGKVCCQVVRANDLYLTVLSGAGEALPAASLATLAAELEKPN